METMETPDKQLQVGLVEGMLFALFSRPLNVRSFVCQTRFVNYDIL